MEIKYENEVTRYSDFEIDKALKNLERGISLATFFKYEAERFKYGKDEYFNMLNKEIEHYENNDWDYFIETNQFDPCEVSEIIEGVNAIKKAISNLNTPPPAKQFKTSLTDTQRGKLFELLVLNRFIPDKDKEGFIWAFGGEQNQPSNWQPIEWIDKSTTRKEPNIQTVYELLYLLGVDPDTSANNPNNLYRKMEFCFSGFKNFAVKNPTRAQQNTPRQMLLKSIIDEVKKVEAQR